MTGAVEAVAVIVPNYNQQKTLRACLEAVYAQTWRPAEVVVVDDASTDGSLEIARSFPCSLVALPGNRGPAAARNAGVAASRAPLLFFVDSDTALAPDAIQNAVQALRDTPDCGVVQGIYDLRPLFDDGLVEAYRVAVEHFDRRRTTTTLLSCTLIPREVFDEAGGLDERLRDGEDVEFGTRVPARYRLVVTDTVVTRADDVDRFWACLRERFVRASTVPLLMVRARRRRASGATGLRLGTRRPGPGDRRRRPRFSSAMAALALFTLPLGAFLPWLLPLPLSLLVGFLAVNREFLRLTYRSRGGRFALFAAGMHLVYSALFFLGVGVGVLRVGRELLRRRGRPVEGGRAPVAPAGARR